MRGNNQRVHRWVWEQLNGPIPEGMKVLHRCDNPPCYRYDHLFLGTQAENLEDMTHKGRRRHGEAPRIRGRWSRITVGALALTTVAGASGCTPDEIQAWVAWHQQDPAAAEAFAAKPEVQAALEEASRPEPSRGWTVNWDAIARCESGGNWSHPPINNRHGTFSGGLMWNHRYWLANGGGEYAQFPYQASKAEQIAVSEDFADGSLGRIDDAWQCYG